MGSEEETEDKETESKEKSEEMLTENKGREVVMGMEKETEKMET